MAQQKTIDIFISYSHHDRLFVEAFVDSLKLDGFSVWWDRNIVSGQLLNDDIEAAIRRSHVVLCVCSRNSAKSKWVQKEIEFAKYVSSKIVPILVDDEPIIESISKYKGHKLDTESIAAQSGGYATVVRDIRILKLKSEEEADSDQNNQRSKSKRSKLDGSSTGGGTIRKAVPLAISLGASFAFFAGILLGLLLLFSELFFRLVDPEGSRALQDIKFVETNASYCELIEFSSAEPFRLPRDQVKKLDDQRQERKTEWYRCMERNPNLSILDRESACGRSVDVFKRSDFEHIQTLQATNFCQRRYPDQLSKVPVCEARLKRYIGYNIWDLSIRNRLEALEQPSLTGTKFCRTAEEAETLLSGRQIGQSDRESNRAGFGSNRRSGKSQSVYQSGETSLPRVRAIAQCLGDRLYSASDKNRVRSQSLDDRNSSAEAMEDWYQFTFDDLLPEKMRVSRKSSHSEHIVHGDLRYFRYNSDTEMIEFSATRQQIEEGRVVNEYMAQLDPTVEVLRDVIEVPQGVGYVPIANLTEITYGDTLDPILGKLFANRCLGADDGTRQYIHPPPLIFEGSLLDATQDEKVAELIWSAVVSAGHSQLEASIDLVDRNLSEHTLKTRVNVASYWLASNDPGKQKIATMVLERTRDAGSLSARANLGIAKKFGLGTHVDVRTGSRLFASALSEGLSAKSLVWSAADPLGGIRIGEFGDMMQILEASSKQRNAVGYLAQLQLGILETHGIGEPPCQNQCWSNARTRLQLLRNANQTHLASILEKAMFHSNQRNAEKLVTWAYNTNAKNLLRRAKSMPLRANAGARVMRALRLLKWIPR